MNTILTIKEVNKIGKEKDTWILHLEKSREFIKLLKAYELMEISLLELLIQVYLMGKKED